MENDDEYFDEKVKIEEPDWAKEYERMVKLNHRERIIQNALIHYINDKVEGGLDWDL